MDTLIKNFKVGVYVRLSKEDDNKEKESESITNQRIFIKEYADKKGLEIADYYVDDGFSGGNFERPDFQRMIIDIESGKINCVITKDTSRLGRDFIETGQYLFKYFPEKNVRYIAIIENFDTFNPNGSEDMIPFQTVVNDIYLKDMSRKIKSVRHEKMAKGLFVGSSVSYGYKRDEEDNRKFVIDEYAANIVKRIFDMKEENKTNNMIARQLTEEKILPPNIYNGKKINHGYTTNLWKASSIGHILKNEIYIGNLIQRQYERVGYKLKKKVKLPREKWIIVENNHEAIISKEQFERINKTKTNGMTRNRKYNYLLKGLVVCAECGKTMLVRKNYYKYKTKISRDNASYCCKTNVTYRNGVCSLHYYKEQALNAEVIKQLRIMLFECADKNILKQKYKEVSEKISRTNDFEKELQICKNKLTIIDKAMGDLYKDRASELLSDEDFCHIQTGLQEDKLRIKEKQADLEIRLNKSKVALNNNAKMSSMIRNFLNVKNLDKQILHQLIRKIEISEDKKVKVYFNFSIKERINV